MHTAKGLDRVMRRAALEDGCFVSVGGLVTDMEALGQMKQMAVRNPSWREEMPTQPGWDGYSAVPTTEAAKEAVARFLAGGAPTVVPLTHGGLQIEWRGCDTCIEFGADGKGEW